MSERTCHRCDALIPTRSEPRGRPRKFCSDSCKNRWRYEVRQERENPRQRDDQRIYEWDVKFYGREEADLRAARRRRRQEEAHGGV